MSALISIIICTRNRAENLRTSIWNIGKLFVPEGWAVELLVVDNGSTDHTPAVIQEFQLNNMNLLHVSEPRTGVSRARNTGLAAAQGEVILFTDDDLSPDRDWLRKIGTPLLEGKCDAAVATVKLAEHLDRPWLEPVHKAWLAVPANPRDAELELTG